MTDEEVERYVRSAMNTPPLSAAEEIRLADLIGRGDQDAFDRFAESYMAWTAARALSFCNQPGIKIAKSDAIQAANVGLMLAARKYDPRSVQAFSDFVLPYVDEQLERLTA